MGFVIRRATRVDAQAIAAVAAEGWPDEPLDAALIMRLIVESARKTLVAELGGNIVGFVDGFATRAASGALRWEVDLLAVISAAQGHGIGRRLVGESVAAGYASQAVQARALIRMGNIASERVFAACGFLPDRDESELWMAEGLAVGEQRSMHVVSVRTFRYAGNWLEEVNAAALRSLRPSADGVTGAVIRMMDREANRAAADAGLQPAGRYRFWQRDLSLSAG